MRYKCLKCVFSALQMWVFLLLFANLVGKIIEFKNFSNEIFICLKNASSSHQKINTNRYCEVLFTI